MLLPDGRSGSIPAGRIIRSKPTSDNLEEMEYLIVETTKSRGQFAYRLNNPKQREVL